MEKRTLAFAYLELVVWESMAGFYKAMGNPVPPKPEFEIEVVESLED